LLKTTSWPGEIETYLNSFGLVYSTIKMGFSPDDSIVKEIAPVKYFSVNLSS